MENNSINKKKIDWNDFRTKVFAEAPAAQTIEDTYPAIARALSLLGDNHSSFVRADGGILSSGTIQCQRENVGAPSLPENIGYVKINSFSGSEAQGVAFAEDIQNKIKNQDSGDIIGWIVDLRDNGGGNMWPMLAGIGPILGEGIAGYFVDPDGVEYPWSYEAGASKSGTSTVVQVTAAYTLLMDNPKVAVLLDNGIASSGEVMAISFIGRSNTKSFGASTCGLSTANAAYNLSNNCKLILTVADLADRNKKTYGVPIQPDQASTTATIIQDAVEWIEQ